MDDGAAIGHPRQTVSTCFKAAGVHATNDLALSFLNRGTGTQGRRGVSQAAGPAVRAFRHGEAWLARVDPGAPGEIVSRGERLFAHGELRRSAMMRSISAAQGCAIFSYPRQVK